MTSTTAHRRVLQLERRRGSATAMIAILMVATVAVAAFVINTTYAEVVRTELQITTDLATRAACKEYARTNDRTKAIQKARLVAAANPVASRIIEISSQDLIFQAATRDEQSQSYAYASRPYNKNSVAMSADFFTRTTGVTPLVPLMGHTAFRPVKSATAVQAELDLAIILDCSTSMLAPLDGSAGLEVPVNVPLFPPLAGSRWSVAKDGIGELLDHCRSSVHEEMVGISFFGTAAVHGPPLDLSYEPIELALGACQLAYIGGLSNLGDGILAGVGMLSNGQVARPWASRVILLITDGNGNLGPHALAAAERAAAEYISIYTVSLSDEANVQLLDEIARLTHGTHFHLGSAEQFRSVAQVMADQLPILITQ